MVLCEYRNVVAFRRLERAYGACIVSCAAKCNRDRRLIGDAMLACRQITVTGTTELPV